MPNSKNLADQNCDRNQGGNEGSSESAEFDVILLLFEGRVLGVGDFAFGRVVVEDPFFVGGGIHSELRCLRDWLRCKLM